MGALRSPLHINTFVNDGERRLVEFLEKRLPADYLIIPNGEFVQVRPGAIPRPYEYDALVVAPHAVFHIENKDYSVPVYGDDALWYVGGHEIRCPVTAASIKSKVLRSILSDKNPQWGKVNVATIVTLSNAKASKAGLDPKSGCFQSTFLLNDTLISRLTDPAWVRKSPRAIEGMQNDIADFLAGFASRRSLRLTQVLGMHIDDVLFQCEDYNEYLCSTSAGLGLKYRVRAYPLDRSGLSADQLLSFRKKAANAQTAIEKVGFNSHVLPAEFSSDEAYYYEKSKVLDDLSLAATMKNRRVQTDIEKARIVRDIASALVAAHDAGVIHRDVSPANIFVTTDGSAVLANFSCAWFAERPDGKRNYTMVSMLADCQTSPYVAPEVATGDDMFASDIYSLGVVAYEMFVGKLPFSSTFSFLNEMGGVLPGDLMPSAVVKEAPHWVDTLVTNTVVADTDKRWGDAREIVAFIDKCVSQATVDPARSVLMPAAPVVNLEDLKPGDDLTNDYTIYEEIGHGGFSRVFRAKHRTNGRFYAVKVFKRGTSTSEARAECEALSDLVHPNIVKYVYNGISNQDLFYTAMELLSGDSLEAYAGHNRWLPLTDVCRMASQILDALVYMQDLPQPVFHRDIKPDNIFLDKSGRFVLIDFNISALSDDNSFAGTLPYIAPDLVTDGRHVAWDASADTFALGVTIYELLTHAHPWGATRRPAMAVQPTDVRQLAPAISEPFAQFVMRAITTGKDGRFANARAMRDALLLIGEDGVAAQPAGHAAVADEDMPTVDYLNSLYSQSRHGNGGTRAALKPGKAAKLDALTYIETRLDAALKPDILSLKYRLIIITGNAGDGKTAFIRQIEMTDGKARQLPSGNGSEFHIKGLRFESNYDGSQDERSTDNDEVLRRFFAPFMSLADFSKAPEGRIIAINEGRLVDFLSKQPELRALRENIENYFFAESEAGLVPGLMVINLNKRSVTAGNGKEGSLLARQLGKMSDRSLWACCGKCGIAAKCFIKYNVDTFADAASGREVAERLEWLLRCVSYKRELHVTMRDLRSLIAFMLTRDCSCDEVRKLVDLCQRQEGGGEIYRRYYYFNITAPAPVSADPDLPPLGSADRLVALLRQSDIAAVPVPPVDNKLFFRPIGRADLLPFPSRGQSVEDVIGNAAGATDREAISDRIKSLVRNLYFEGSDVRGEASFKRRLPSRYAVRFYAALNNGRRQDELKKSIAMAISASEGCDNERLSDSYMLLSDTRVKDPIAQSYRMFPLSEFELFAEKADDMAPYVETESDCLTFRHKTDKAIRLSISLDLFEMLNFIRDGFCPSAADLSGRFIELQIFKNMLESRAYSELLVTRDNEKFCVVSIDDDRNISFKPLQLAELPKAGGDNDE